MQERDDKQSEQEEGSNPEVGEGPVPPEQAEEQEALNHEEEEYAGPRVRQSAS